MVQANFEQLLIPKSLEKYAFVIPSSRGTFWKDFEMVDCEVFDRNSFFPTVPSFVEMTRRNGEYSGTIMRTSQMILVLVK
jgi:hypothetical protein